MTEEQAIAISDNLLLAHTGKPLNDLERSVLKGSLQRQKYQQIATNTHQTQRYIKDIGAALWRKLAEALGDTPVKKNTIYSVLERHSVQQSHQAIEISLETSSVTSSSTTPKIAADILAEYRQNYCKHHSQIKILPGLMQKPLPLDAIYVAVKVLRKSHIQFLSSTNVEAAYRQFHRKNLFGSELARQDGVLVAKKNQYLMVLGGPGVGKSTFLKKLGLEAFKSDKLCIPVLVELRRAATAGIGFEDYALRAFQKIKDVNTAPFIAHHLEQGNFLFLLDGLDEVPKHKSHKLIDQIHEFINQYDRNRFVISCRTAAHTFNFSHFVDVIIADFDDVQIKQFIQYWFPVKSPVKSPGKPPGKPFKERNIDLAEYLGNQLDTPRNSALKDLARSPLLLTYLCLICEVEKAIPNTRKDLYAKALELILEDWDNQKNIRNGLNLRQHGLTPRLEKTLLSEIAHENFSDDHLLFSRTQLLKKIRSFLQMHCREDKIPTTDPDWPQSVLNVIELRQGILVERFTDYFSFSHLTFQEYLTAYFIVENRLVQQVLSDHCADNRWREVILLAAELMEEEVASLITGMLEHINQCFVRYSKLKNIVKWVNRFLAGNNVNATLAMKASMIATISVIASSRASDFDLDVRAGEQAAHALAKACEIAMVMSQEEFITYKAAVTCAVAIACSRAVACELAESASHPSASNLSVEALVFTPPPGKARSIDEVVHDASDMINSASDDRGIIKKYNRSQVANKAISFACALTKMPESESECLSDTFITAEMSQTLEQLAKEIPEQSSTPNSWYQWAQQLESTWLEFLGVDREFVLLSVEEAQAWQQYIYLTELLLSCQASTLHLSPAARTAVEQQLLT